MEIPIKYQILENYSFVNVTGPDSAKLLQGQLTCNIDKAETNKALLGGYCNVQGRLHAVFHLLKQANGFLLLMPTEIHEHFVQTLSKYAVFFQTEIQSDDQYTILASEQKPTTGESYRSFELGSLTINVIKNSQVQDFIAKSLPEHQAIDEDIFSLEQIKQSIPMIFTETIETQLPHYIGLAQKGGVDFEKGCYTGQEVVARMHYRGTLKTHPHRISFDSDIAISPLSEVQDNNGKKVGELVYSAIEQNKTYGLISLKDKANHDELFIDEQPMTIVNSQI